VPTVGVIAVLRLDALGAEPTGLRDDRRPIALEVRRVAHPVGVLVRSCSKRSRPRGAPAHYAARLPRTSARLVENTREIPCGSQVLKSPVGLRCEGANPPLHARHPGSSRPRRLIVGVGFF
jgi:hypothetical protein